MAWQDFAPFNSSNIASARYDQDALLLEVEFHTGGRYQYHGVPELVAAEFQNAESKGKYLASSIKGHYRYSKV